MARRPTRPYTARPGVGGLKGRAAELSGAALRERNQDVKRFLEPGGGRPPSALPGKPRPSPPGRPPGRPPSGPPSAPPGKPPGIPPGGPPGKPGGQAEAVARLHKTASGDNNETIFKFLGSLEASSVRGSGGGGGGGDNGVPEGPCDINYVDAMILMPFDVDFDSVDVKARPATLVNAPVIQSVTKAFGANAGDFTPAGSYVTYPSDTGLTIERADFTIEAFFRFPSAAIGTSRGILTNMGNTSLPGTVLRMIGNPSKIEFIIGLGTGPFSKLIGTTTIVADTWYYAKGVYVASSDTMELFLGLLDGNVGSEGTLTRGATGAGTNPEFFISRVFTDLGGFTTEGFLDNCRFTPGFARSAIGSAPFAVPTKTFEAVACASTKVYDQFTEGANTNLAAHTPDIGTGWTERFHDGAGVFQVFSADDEVGNTLEEVDVGAIYTVQPGLSKAEYDVEAKVIGDSSAGDDSPFWLIARYVDNNNYYGAGFWRQPTGTDAAIFKVVGGVVTTLASADLDIDLGTVFVRSIRFEVRDGAKKLFLDDVERLTTADNTLTTAGEAGIGAGNLRVSTDDLTSEIRFDNFTVIEA